jgi:hypothetical protein
VEIFDIGFSRERAGGERPWAAALLAAVAYPDRGFDAADRDGLPDHLHVPT